MKVTGERCRTGRQGRVGGQLHLRWPPRLATAAQPPARLLHLTALQISAFFPGHHAKAMAQNAEMRRLEEEVAALLAGVAAPVILQAGWRLAGARG